VISWLPESKGPLDNIEKLRGGKPLTPHINHSQLRSWKHL
jgi:hypothetical protein